MWRIQFSGRAPDCGSGCRGFEPHYSPFFLFLSLKLLLAADTGRNGGRACPTSDSDCSQSPSVASTRCKAWDGRNMVCCVMRRATCDGVSPSGKARDFDSRIRRFEPCHPSMYDPLAQSAEHLTFNQGVRSSNLRWVTIKHSSKEGCFYFFVLKFYG